MKICYILLVHHKFEQVRRLIGRLDAPGVSFVIHIDRKVPQAEVAGLKASLAGVAKVHYARRVDAGWGSYRLAEAIMYGIETAARQADFDRAVLMSGQDYPIASHDEIVRRFREAADKEFIEAHLLDLVKPDVSHWTPYYRFRKVHVWFGRRRLAVPGVTRRLPPVPLFHGSAWWALTREAVHYVAYRFAADAALRRYLQTGFLVDEVYVQTVLMSSPVFAHRVTRHNLTVSQFTADSGPHPKTLLLGDAELLLDSSKLFARKFDPIDSGPLLDWLDAKHGRA